MARVTHAPLAAPTEYPAVLPLPVDSQDVVFAAADVTNKEQVALTGHEIILARNSGASARTVTINSAPDPFNFRVGDITAYSIGAGETARFGPFPTRGWAQPDGNLYFEANNAEVLFAVIAADTFA